MKKSHEMNMTEGPLFLKTLLFALPVMASNILQVLFNAVDVVVVGKCVGDDALAAVGSTGSTYGLFVNLAMGLGVGTNVVIGKYYGAKRTQDMSDALHTSIAAAIAGGIIVSLSGLLLARPLLLLLGTPEEVLDSAALYLKIVLSGSVLSFIYNFAANALRAIGDTKRPLYYLMIAGVSNVFFNLFFVIVCKLGVVGVALGTILSQAISAFLVMRALCKEEGSLAFSWKKLRFNKDRLLELLKIGMPSGIQGILFSVSNMTVQSSINYFGKVVVAGNSAASNIENLHYNAMNAFYSANVSITAQNYGARKQERMKKSLFISSFYVIVTGLVIGVLFLLFGEKLLSFYTNSEETIAAGMQRIRTLSIPYFFCGLMDVFCASLRGMGYSFVSTMNSLLGSCAFRMIWLFTYFKANPTISAVFIVYPISWALTFFIHAVWLIFLFRKVKKSFSQQL